jgi:hypothetical protein
MLGDAIRNGQNAKTMLSKLDDMSDEDCKVMLDAL